MSKRDKLNIEALQSGGKHYKYDLSQLAANLSGGDTKIRKSIDIVTPNILLNQRQEIV